ncbi:MAG: cupredoxin domain-containing protein [Chloroflexi bacterium]|nr:cupredoxin domain-containing protein [Chloroflexota bacterium]
MTQKDFKLDPDNLTVKAGAVTFVLKNEGRYTHDFRVEGQGTDAKAPKVGSGRTQEWRVTLKPGTYRISCPISNHADRGMVGALTVVP